MTSLVAQTVRHLPTMRETWVGSLGREDPLEKEMATLSSTRVLENPMDGGAWWATVHGVAKSWTQLSDFTFFLSLTYQKIMRKEWNHLVMEDRIFTFHWLFLGKLL